MSKGNLFIIAAPSGAGKTSLVKGLIGSVKHLTASISYTTRLAREQEVDGVNYHFVTSEAFDAMVKEKAFLEYATVYGAKYGTAKPWVMAQLEKGEDVILEIDWQGARQIRANFPEAIGIFIVPPSLSALEQRLRSRGQDSEAIIERRMAQAKEELSHYHEFDYLVINDDFSKALGDLMHIVCAERLKTTIQFHVNNELLEALGQNG